MVGLFWRFSGNKSGHRRTQSALANKKVKYVEKKLKKITAKNEIRYLKKKDEGAVLSHNSEGTGAPIVTTAAHGIEVAVEFKPLEHPTEPLNNDQPIQCPLPEPSILNDGRIWKERASAGVRRRPDLPAMPEGTGTPTESEAVVKKVKPRPPSKRTILPSVSAPEHNILKLLEECNASGI